MPLMAVTMLTAGAMLLMKCCRMDNVIKYIDWQLLLVLGSTLVFSVAITKTGIANIIAQTVLQMCADNPYIVMGVMCLLASAVSEFVSDVGSSVIFFPIVFEQSQLMGCNPMPFIMSLMLSVTLSFSSPIGSNTHMLVYGPGSFKFTDFARIGIWMHLLLLVVCLVVVNLIYPLH
jgi:di/tricarboxylate transporter